MRLQQPQLIESILQDLGLSKGSKAVKTPTLISKIITPDPEGAKFDNRFDYRSVIGKLNYLEKSTRPDLAYAVHQCARFCSDPKQSHGEAVKRIGRYLLGTREKGMTFAPDHNKSFECWVDASHAGEWNRSDAEFDPDTARSRTGYILTYAGCPLIWASKLQTEIALSSTEAEYIALSQALREVIPLMQLMKEAKRRGLDIAPKASIHCTAFEDNTGALEMARVPKMRPRTKHLNIKYHHFREYVKAGKISIQHVSTEDQVADMLTKPLSPEKYEKHRTALVGFSALHHARLLEHRKRLVGW